MDGGSAQWRWLGDPDGDAPGFLARVTRASGTPRLAYRTMIWTLVREPASPAITGSASSLSYGLRYEADGLLSYPQWLAIPIWLDRRARLQRRIEGLMAIAVNPGEGESALEELLSLAATEIDGWLRRWGLLEPERLRRHANHSRRP